MLNLDSPNYRLIITNCRNAILLALVSSQSIFTPMAFAVDATNKLADQSSGQQANDISANSEKNESTADSHRLLLKPGQTLIGGMKTEDIIATYDVQLAKEQVAAYPDSPEASFVLAVALTRTSMVEDALKEVRKARKLAEKQGGPAYFDHMIAEYEEMLKSYPNDNRVRYGLAWAYYMKAYVLTHYARSIIGNKKENIATTQTKTTVIASQPSNGQVAGQSNWQSLWVKSLTTSPSSPVTNETATKRTMIK